MKRTYRLITIASLLVTGACSGADDQATDSSNQTDGVAGKAEPGTSGSGGSAAAGSPNSGSGGALANSSGGGADLGVAGRSGAASGGLGGGGAAGTSAAGASAAGASAGGVAGSAGAHHEASSPGELLGGLQGWHLTLPTGPSDHADEIKQPDLANEVVPGYFELGPAKDRVVMTDLFGGARTSSGTAFARTELRQDYSGGGALSNKAWDCKSSKHSLWVKQRITLSPIHKPEMSIGQIHDDANDMLEVRYIGPEDSKGIGTGNGKTDTGVIEAHFNNDTSFEKLDGAYQLGQEMSLTISTDGKGNMLVEYENLATHATQSAHAAFGSTKLGCYFKAGNYHQACSLKDINGATNQECEGKKWAASRYETDPMGKSVLELFELRVD